MNLQQANALNDRFFETGFEKQLQEAVEWLKKALDAQEIDSRMLYHLGGPSLVHFPLVFFMPWIHIVNFDTVYLELPLDSKQVEIIAGLLPLHVHKVVFQLIRTDISSVVLDHVQKILRLPQVTSLVFPNIKIISTAGLEPFRNITQILMAPYMSLEGLSRVFPNLQTFPLLKHRNQYKTVFTHLPNIKEVIFCFVIFCYFLLYFFS